MLRIYAEALDRLRVLLNTCLVTQTNREFEEWRNNKKHLIWNKKLAETG